MYIYLSFYPSIHPSIYLSIYLYISLSISLSICLSIYLSKRDLWRVREAEGLGDGDKIQRLRKKGVLPVLKFDHFKF